MGASTGIVLATGAIAIGNELFFAPLAGTHGENYASAFKLVPATLGLALGLDLLERIAPGFAVGLAWLTMLGMFVWHPGTAKSPLDNITAALGY